MVDHNIESDNRSRDRSDSDHQPDMASPPPPYSETLGQISESNENVGTNASIAKDGRVNISIDQRSRRFSNLLSSAFKPSEKHETPRPEPYVPPSLGGRPGQVPPPRLNIVIQVVGSRGDVQPFVALGKVLQQEYGHRIRLATHPVFRDFVHENGLEFFSIGGDPAELMAFMVRNPGLMPGRDALMSGDIGKRRRNIGEMIKGCWRSCFEAGDGSGAPQTDQTLEQWFDRSLDPNTTNPDAYAAAQATPFVADCIIANPPSFAHIHIAERLGIPLHIMFTMPWSPTHDFPHPLANIVSSNAEKSATNHISYILVDMLTWQGLGDVLNRFRVQDLGLEPMSLMWGPGTLSRLKVPHTYCWSPALIPRPSDWQSHISVSGFFFLSLASNYTPEPDLAAFLDAGPPPVYIGFGSIVVDDPNAMTKLIFEAVKMTGQRALVSKGWGGLGANQLGIPEGVFMLGNVPHDWLFTKVSCVVHHGGAGTTAAGIACGKPTVIVPFFGDQPWWGNMVAKAGAGPPPIPHQELTAQKLAEAIKFALEPASLERARELAQKVGNEKGNERGAQSFHQMLPLDRMRCTIFPDRAAVFRVKRTKILLSTKAAYILYMQKKLTWDNLKMHRPQEYEADIGPVDPISGGATAIIGTMSQAMMGFVDMPVETLKLFQNTTTPEGKEKLKTKARRLSGASRGKEAGKDSKKPSSSSQSSTVASSGALSPAPSSNYLNLGSSMSTDASTITSSGSAASTQFEPMSPSVDSEVLTIRQSPPGSPISRSTDSQIKTPEGSSTPRGRPSSMADAMSALKDCSASPIRSRRTSPSPTPSSEGRPRRSTLGSRSPNGSQTTTFKHNPLEGSGPFTLDTLYGTSKGVSRIVGAGLRSPLDFTMAISKGFHNLPRFYGEEPRPVDRVTDMSSGVRTAGKEFGRGIFDGITGLVTQPISGARKEGASGFLKGVGRGIAGIVVKPGAAAYALPAYAMMGVYKSIQNHLGESTASYILSGRIAQGFAEWSESPEHEQAEALAKWDRILEDVKVRKGMGLLTKEKTKEKNQPTSTPKSSSIDKEAYLNTLKSFVDKQREKRRLKQEADGSRPPLGKDRISSTPQLLGPPSPPDYTREASHSPTLHPIPKERTNLAYESDDEEQELEEAIRLSLVSDQASASAGASNTFAAPHDDDDEDTELRRAITNSLEEMRKADEDHEEEIFHAKYASKSQALEEDREAMRTAEVRHQEDLARALEESRRFAEGRGATDAAPLEGFTRTGDDNNDEKTRMHIEKTLSAPPEYHEGDALRKAMEESLVIQRRRQSSASSTNEDVRKALEESKRIQDEEERNKREEEIVLEYVKKQSLAEDKFKKGKVGESST